MFSGFKLHFVLNRVCLCFVLGTSEKGFANWNHSFAQTQTFFSKTSDSKEKDTAGTVSKMFVCFEDHPTEKLQN